MRKSQKLLAFVLAMMMAFSLMSLAAAYDEADGHGYECTECSGDEGIMPAWEVGAPGPPCSWCGGTTAWTLLGYDDADYPVYGYKCINNHIIN